MCGIFCCLSRSDRHNNICYEEFSECLSSRGPDAVSRTERRMPNGAHALLVGHTLWTQGLELCPQPLNGPNDQALLWNGDVFGGMEVPVGKCDSDMVLSSLVTSENVCQTLAGIIGPYSFAYLDSDDSLWFGRDPLGRQSLLWIRDETCLLLSSVVSSSQKLAYELPAFGIFKATMSSPGFCQITLHPWSHLEDDFNKSLLPDDIVFGEAIDHHILHNLKSMFFSHPALLVPPGIENYSNEFLPGRDQVELLDALLINHPSLAALVAQVESILDEAVALRMKMPPYCKQCLPLRQSPCTHAKVAILFSGGIDSTLLAVIASRHISKGETVDLWNVAFDRDGSGKFDVPDRKTALLALEELKVLAPHVNWNFVQVNVCKNDLQYELERRVGGLIFPLVTVLDADLGAALWFASTGMGTSDDKSSYISPARIVLVGMGADEQAGGYRKAAAAWSKGGWSALSAELWAGLRDIPARNLGRDNRVISDHGLAPRMPFLHEPLVALLASLPPWQKWHPGVGGDKMILRLVARKCGLRGSAVLAKRAMQFGSRIAQRKQAAHAVAPCLKKFTTSSQ